MQSLHRFGNVRDGVDALTVPVVCYGCPCLRYPNYAVFGHPGRKHMTCSLSPADVLCVLTWSFRCRSAVAKTRKFDHAHLTTKGSL